jgi:hypothetical protein
MRTRLVSVVAVLLAAASRGCAEDEERAPLLAPNGGVINPVSCEQLWDEEPQANAAGGFWVSGGTAECVSDGQWCPAGWLEGFCEAGTPYAQCLTGRWVLSCPGGDGS